MENILNIFKYNTNKIAITIFLNITKITNQIIFILSNKKLIFLKTYFIIGNLIF